MYWQEHENDDAGEEAEDVDDEMEDIETLHYDDLDKISKLQKTQRYIDIMQVCAEQIQNICKENKHSFMHFYTYRI